MLIKSKFFYSIIALAFVVLLYTLAWAEKPSWSVGNVHSPSYTLEGSKVCLSCHSGETMHAMAASAHGKLNSPDSPVPSQGCESCHGPGSFHVSRAHGGKGFPALATFGRGKDVASSQEQIDTCLSCHEKGSGGTRPILWWGSVHDRSSINCSRCHLIHTASDPIKEKEQQDKVCFKCHRKQKTRHPEFENKDIDFAAYSCSTCHDVHNKMKVIKTQETNPEQ